jgi:transcriptional regulator MraZ
MLLTGTYPRTLDEKNRLTLPKRVRELLAEPATLFITPGPDQSLWLYLEAELERLAARLDQSPATDAEARTFRRLYFAQMEQADLDQSGRLVIPERLATFAGLQKEVILIGVRDHLELWDATRWQNYVGQNAARFDTVAEKAFTKT